MLFASVYINNTCIDLICIQNTGDTEGSRHVYKVLNYNTKEVILDRVLHNRKMGYRPLLSKVLRELDKQKVEEIIPERKNYGPSTD